MLLAFLEGLCIFPRARDRRQPRYSVALCHRAGWRGVWTEMENSAIDTFVFNISSTAILLRPAKVESFRS